MRASLVFLIVSLAVIAILTWQAVSAASGHRALADGVLRDYADLAAVEVVRRGSTFLFTYGFDVGAQALARARASSGTDLPSREAIRAAMPDQSKRAIELVGSLVRVDTERRTIDVAGDPVPAEIEGDLITTLLADPPSRAPSRVITLTALGRTHVFAFTTDRPAASQAHVHVGFAANLDAVGTWLDELVLGEPLLPPSLASRATARSSLAVAVTSPDGRRIAGPPARDQAGTIVVVRPWEDEASRRVLLGFNVISTLDLSAASSLIIGGLPQSRLLPLFVLLGLAALMAVAAVVQLRRARALADLRQDFVTRTSHELRTPVARIRIFADTLLLDRVRTDDERRAAVHAIDRAARRLSMLVENVLQFSRSEAGNADLNLQPTDVVAHVRDVVAEQETIVNAPDSVVVTAPPRIDAAIDREGVRQALLNLLDNAWKYGGPDRSIRVDVSATDRDVRVAVTDAGPGIPESDRARVWEPYVRLDRDRQSSVAGTGIGLAVVKDIVTRHRGRCWIDGAESGGTTVTVALPRGAVDNEKKAIA